MKDDIKGCPGYHISKDGILYCRGKPIKVFNHHNGYLRRRINGKNLTIHRLVALAYIPNPENKPCVCHKDNNKHNNHYKNLYWGTYKENRQQASDDGVLNIQGINNPMYGIHRYGIDSPHHKLTTRQVRRIKRLLKLGITQKFKKV